MELEKFERLVEEGINAIPEKFRLKLKNVRIVVEEQPTALQKKKLKLKPNWTLFGLYEGVPQSKRGLGYNFVMPDKITIFKRPIEQACNTEDEIREQVRQTVWHEIAHHFGLNEAEVRAKEKQKKAK